MQTAPSAITGFTAPASGGKLPSKNEDQRDDTAGFATSLRSAMPQEDSPQTPAQLAAGSATSDAIDTIESPDAIEAGDPGQIKRNRSRYNEKTLVRALKANTNKPSGVSTATLTQQLVVDADDATAVNSKQPGIAPEHPMGLTSEASDITHTKAEETTDADKTAAVREQTSTGVEAELEAELDAPVNPFRPAREALEQHDSHTTTLADTDPGDSPPLRGNQAESSADSIAVASNPSDLGTEVTDPPPEQESTEVLTDQKPGSPPAVSLNTVAVVPASTTTTTTPTAEDEQSIATGATQTGPHQAKTARAEPQTAVTGQTPGRQGSNKAGASTSVASPQEKSLEASLTSGPASRSTQSHGTVPGKVRGAGHHKSASRAKTIYRGGEAPKAKAKPDSVASAKGDALTLKQAAAGSAGLAEIGVDRAAAASSNSASKSSATSADLTASLPHLPDIDAPLDPANVSEAFQGQLGERLVMAVRNDMSRAEIRINPNELGPITIELHIDGNTTAINFAAENNSTRNALQDSLPSLRDQLAREGLTLGEASVGGQPNRSSDQNNREQQLTQWTELRSDPSEPQEERALPDGYRPAQPARGLVDLFA